MVCCVDTVSSYEASAIELVCMYTALRPCVHLAHRSATNVASLQHRIVSSSLGADQKAKPHIRHIHCRWISWNSIVICVQVFKTVVGLAVPISHLELYNVWERSVGEGGGGGRWVSLASSRPPPAPSPPTGEPNTQHVRSSSIGADKNKQHLLQTSRLHVCNVAGPGFNYNPDIIA